MGVYLCVCIYMKWIKCHLKCIVWAWLCLVSIFLHTTIHSGCTVILSNANSQCKLRKRLWHLLFFVLLAPVVGHSSPTLALITFLFPIFLWLTCSAFFFSLFCFFPAESHARVSHAVWLHLQQQILHWHFHHSLPQQERPFCWKDQEITSEYLFPRVHG